MEAPPNLTHQSHLLVLSAWISSGCHGDSLKRRPQCGALTLGDYLASTIGPGLTTELLRHWVLAILGSPRPQQVRDQDGELVGSRGLATHGAAVVLADSPCCDRTPADVMGAALTTYRR
jgi:hypothetical protein